MTLGRVCLLGTVLLAMTSCVEPGAGRSAPPAAPENPSHQASPAGEWTASPTAVPAAASANASTAPASAESSPLARVPAIVFASSAILAAYAGALLLIQAERGDANVRRFDAQTQGSCPDEDPESAGLCGERLATIHETNKIRSVGIGMLLAGGLLGAGAGVFLLLFPQREAQGTRAKSNAGVRVVPFAGIGTAGVVLQGSF